MKRTFDIILAILSIIIFAIPMLLIYLSICLSGGGCVIYRQERIGYKGKPFMLYKFRSMKTNAEMDGQPMLFTNDDPRLTRIGRFLRAHHLDEFPQLWNILRGEMSFVGPRPERKYYIDQILQRRPDYVRLYALRPGIFSRATLYNGYTDTIDKMITRLDMDLAYLEERTLWLDIKIIGLTAIAIITGKKF
jgi:lipopolysaccharide/colanic/teichoic acid biosynthesis glycosyltransferase